MSKSRYQWTLTVAAALVLTLSGCSQPAPGPLTEEIAIDAEQLMRGMSETLADTPVFRFTTQESLEPITAQSGDGTLRFSRTVTVQRPDAMFFELEGDGDSGVVVSACYDGSTVSLYDEADGVWAETEVPGTLDDMLDDVARRYALPIAIADVIYSSPYDAFVGPDSTGGLVGSDTIGGTDCAHLSYEDPWIDVHIWIPISGPPLPRRVELVYKQVSGAPRAEIDYTGWELEPQDAGAVCSFDPDPDATRIAFEDFVATLFAGGTPEPPDGGGVDEE